MSAEEEVKRQGGAPQMAARKCRDKSGCLENQQTRTQTGGSLQGWRRHPDGTAGYRQARSPEARVLASLTDSRKVESMQERGLMWR